MRRIALLLLLFAGPPLLAAPAPFPKPRAKPRVVREFWEVDFSPLAKAGMVNLRLQVSVSAPGYGQGTSVGQVGQVLVAPIVEAFHRSFPEAVINADKTKLTFKSLKGRPVTSVRVTLTGLDKKFSPVALPPTKKK
jgi:hypothetical protein